jgi:hypothetical protein
VIKYANSINNFYLDIEIVLIRLKLIKHTNITTILKEELLREETI